VRRIVVLALSVWLSVIVSIVLFTIFWCVGMLRPHAFWGFFSVVLVLIPLVWLTILSLWRMVRGPNRGQATGWLLVGATPIIWISALLTDARIRTDNRHAVYSPPVRVATVWVSSIFEIYARLCYPQWTHGRHTVLIDDGTITHPERLVADMDRHIRAMSDLLGQSVPAMEIAWVRGPLFRFKGKAILCWAFTGRNEDPNNLTSLDRHEVAHTLITALSEPGHHPPTLLREGWAVSQSRDRHAQIRNLAKKHREGSVYSLKELTGPDMYERGLSPVYWVGGPVVHFLMERYGPEVFFKLYSSSRKDNFFNNCQGILGHSWEEVEKEFWDWLEAKEAKLVKADGQESKEMPQIRIELAESVTQPDWQAIVDGIRTTHKDIIHLPSNTSFVLEGERTEPDTEAPGGIKHTDFEFRAIFEKDHIWIFENGRSIPQVDRFLMCTPAGCADLRRNRTGSFDGRLRRNWFYTRRSILNQASKLVSFYLWGTDPTKLHPFQEKPRTDGICRIERIVRPDETDEKKWRIDFNWRSIQLNQDLHYQVELDATHNWGITRNIWRTSEGGRTETTAEFGLIGNSVLPVRYNSHSISDQGEFSGQWRLRTMSESEKKELKQRIEKAARSIPSGPYRDLQVSLRAMALLTPLIGLALLGTRRDRARNGKS
jgi:hypothetical protein